VLPNFMVVMERGPRTQVDYHQTRQAAEDAARTMGDAGEGTYYVIRVPPPLLTVSSALVKTET